MEPHDETGLGLAFGTYEDAREWIGRTFPAREAEAPVSEAMIRYYCSLVEDGNPAYWEDGVCPPGLTMTLGFRLQWRPGSEDRTNLFAMNVPVPGRHLINVSTDTEFARRIKVGEVVSVTDEVVDVSEEKATRLGRGHFITTRSTFRDSDGRECAVNTNVLFRYEVAEPE